MYMYDQCQSLRAIVDLLSAASSPPELPGGMVELREPGTVEGADIVAAVEMEAPPVKKATHRDAKRG